MLIPSLPPHYRPAFSWSHSLCVSFLVLFISNTTRPRPVPTPRRYFGPATPETFVNGLPGLARLVGPACVCFRLAFISYYVVAVLLFMWISSPPRPARLGVQERGECGDLGQRKPPRTSLFRTSSQEDCGHHIHLSFACISIGYADEQ